MKMYWVVSIEEGKNLPKLHLLSTEHIKEQFEGRYDKIAIISGDIIKHFDNKDLPENF